MSKQQVNLPGTDYARPDAETKGHLVLSTKKIANHSLTPQRLVRKTWNTIDTGIQLHVKITKCAKRILNKGLIYYKGKPFTFDKDTHYIGCWVNRYFSWAKVLSVFQASIKIISIYRSSMCYLLLFLLLLLSLKRMLNSRTFITKFDILYLCSVTHKNQNINRCKKVLTSKNTFKQEHLPLHIEINT